jgi:hypothetical protein
VLATSTVRAIRMLGHEVDVVLNDATSWCEPVLRIPEIGEVLTGFEEGAEVEGYDVVARTCWGPLVRAKGAKFVSSRPGAFRTGHELDSNMLPAVLMGWRGQYPAPMVTHADVPGEEIAGGHYWALCTGCKPGAVWSKKRAPDEFWRALAETMVRPVFLGGEHDSRPWMSEVGLDLCGKTSIDVSVGWLAGAEGVVAVDCGLAHCAAAAGAPTTVLFGPTSVTKNRPVGPRVRVLRTGVDCQPCQFTARMASCKDNRCMGFDTADVWVRLEGRGG